jgi:hypothetical protein
LYPGEVAIPGDLLWPSTMMACHMTENFLQCGHGCNLLK